MAEILKRFLSKDVVDRIPDALKPALEEALRGMNEYREKYKKQIREFYQHKAQRNQLFLRSLHGNVESAQQHNLKELVSVQGVRKEAKN